MTKVFWGVFLALFALTAIIAVLFFLGVIDFASAVNQVAEQNAQWVQAAMVAQRQAVVREQQLRQCVRLEDLRRHLATDERCAAGTVIQIGGRPTRSCCAQMGDRTRVPAGAGCARRCRSRGMCAILAV